MIDMYIVNANCYIKHRTVTINLLVANDNNEVQHLTFQTSITDELVLKDFFEQELKKSFADSYNLCQKAEDTLIVANEKILQIQGTEGRDFEEEIKDLNEKREDLLNELNDKFDDFEIDNPDDLDEEDIEDLEDEEDKEQVSILIEDIENIDYELDELKNLQRNVTEECIIGDANFSNVSIENELIIDELMKTVPLGSLFTYFSAYLQSSDLQYEYTFKPFMIPLTLTFGGFDGENLDMEKITQCHQALKDRIYQLYKAIPGEESKN